VPQKGSKHLRRAQGLFLPSVLIPKATGKSCRTPGKYYNLEEELVLKPTNTHQEDWIHFVRHSSALSVITIQLLTE